MYLNFGLNIGGYIAAVPAQNVAVVLNHCAATLKWHGKDAGHDTHPTTVCKQRQAFRCAFQFCFTERYSYQCRCRGSDPPKKPLSDMI